MCPSATYCAVVGSDCAVAAHSSPRVSRVRSRCLSRRRCASAQRPGSPRPGETPRPAAPASAAPPRRTAAWPASRPSPASTPRRSARGAPRGRRRRSAVSPPAWQLDEPAILASPRQPARLHADELGQQAPGVQPRRVIVIAGNHDRRHAGAAHPLEERGHRALGVRRSAPGSRTRRPTSAAGRCARAR